MILRCCVFITKFRPSSLAVVGSLWLCLIVTVSFWLLLLPPILSELGERFLTKENKSLENYWNLFFIYRSVFCTIPFTGPIFFSFDIGHFSSLHATSAIMRKYKKIEHSRRWDKKILKRPRRVIKASGSHRKKHGYYVEVLHKRSAIFLCQTWTLSSGALA